MEYNILKTYEAGIVLSGTEVKSVKNNMVDIVGSYISIIGSRAFLKNVEIPAYQPTNLHVEYNATRPRELLLNKKELAEIALKTQEKSLTIIPLKLYNKNHLIKLEIAIVSRKKKADKREYLKKKTDQKEMRRHMGA